MPTLSSSPWRSSFRELLAARSCRLLLLAAWGLVVATSAGVRINQIQSNHVLLLHEGAHKVALTILAMRSWNADTEGLYTPVSPGLQPNPFLHHPRRELRTLDGQTLTMVNPAYMTRLVSEVLGKTTPLRVSLRSQRPLNPANQADAWETEALYRFEQGQEEVFGEVRQADGHKEFRYMLAVRTEENCLNCHAAQGDRLGGIRGGLSISLPADDTELHGEMLFVVLRHLAVFVMLGSACYALLGLLGKRWEQDQQRLEKERLDEKMTALERLVQRFCEELRPPLQQSIQMTAQTADDITSLSRRLELEEGETSPALPALPRLQERIGDALANLQEMMHRINSLHHASVSLGEESQRLNLTDLLGNILQTRMASYRHCAQVEVICLPDTEICGVPGLIEQIFGILIANSVEHGFAKGTRQGHIRIEANLLTDGTLRISYADDGVGMPPERLACVFDPFPEPTGTDHRQGLSLYICYSLITFRMGGSIRCDSLVGGGTHFFITLPGTPDLPQC